MTTSSTVTTTTIEPGDAPPAALEAARDRFTEIFARLAVGAGDRDLSGEHPDGLVAELAAAGFGKLRIPLEFGGFGVDLPTLFEILAEAGAADSNIPQIWRGHFTTTEILLHEPDLDARAFWANAVVDGAVFGNAQSESAAQVAGLPRDSGFGPLATRVHAVGDAEYVTGTKFYSTGSRFADLIRVAVIDDDGRRRFAVVSAHHPGVAHIDDWDGVGQRQTGSGTTVFTEVPVKPHGNIGSSAESLRGLNSFVQIVHLANLTGIAASIVAETVEIVRGRTRTSLHALTQEATADPEVLGVIGILRTRELTARTLLRHAAAELESANDIGTEDAYTRAYLETSAAQIAVIDAVLDAATTAFDAGGSSTARTSVHLDRHWRNARTLASHNPVIYKPRIIGDHLVNSTVPISGYYPTATTPTGSPT